MIVDNNVPAKLQAYQNQLSIQQSTKDNEKKATAEEKNGSMKGARGGGGGASITNNTRFSTNDCDIHSLTMLANVRIL